MRTPVATLASNSKVAAAGKPKKGPAPKGGAPKIGAAAAPAMKRPAAAIGAEATQALGKKPAGLALKRPAAAAGDKDVKSFLDKDLAGVWRQLRADAKGLSRNAASFRGSDAARRECKRQGISEGRLLLIAHGAAQRARDIWEAS